MVEKPYSPTQKSLPRYQTKEVITNILDKAKKDRYRNYILLLILWRTGLRVSEVVKLEKRDIIEGNLLVRLGKGKKDRVVPLESELDTLLLGYIDAMKSRDKLFKFSDRQVRNVVKKYTPDELKKDIHPHTFRHSFAVYCLKNGMNLRTLQKILGHSSLTTTQKYLDIVGQDITDDFKKVVW